MPATKPKVKKVCPSCDVEFFVKPSVADVRRCCSVKCQGLWKRSKRVEISCLECGKRGQYVASELKWGKKYCNRKCWNKAFGKRMVGNKVRSGIVPWNKGLTGIKTGKEGARPSMVGKNNPAYRSGSAKPRTRKDLQTAMYRQWRSDVFARDNYTCQICFDYGVVFHADHIERWADNEELRYNVDNGRTLCVPCHYYITFKTKMKPGTNWCNFMAGKRG